MNLEFLSILIPFLGFVAAEGEVKASLNWMHFNRLLDVVQRFMCGTFAKTASYGRGFYSYGVVPQRSPRRSPYSGFCTLKEAAIGSMEVIDFLVVPGRYRLAFVGRV